jgi:NHS family xanthosine MFS transporter
MKQRLIFANFLQFFVWGTWLISLGGYMIGTLKLTGGQVGSVYATMGLASIFMPALLGIVADRWMNTERLFGLCHLAGAVLLFQAARATDYSSLYSLMLLNSLVYMPSIGLNNTLSFHILESRGFDIIRHFPPIRVWGTIGFIAAMWAIDFCGWTRSAGQLYAGSASALLLGIYAFTLPACPPAQKREKRGFLSAAGLDAFVLFRQPRMVVFFTFAMLLGAALQITNAFGGAFLADFKGTYADSFGVKHPNLLLSVSQISETLFILAIPFFLRRFGIKKVMLMSMFAWVFRFGLFAVGDPGPRLILLVLSMIIYGMAFDFFNISGSLFVGKEADVTIRASAQGLFMLMTNGVGAYIGGMLSGLVVDHFTSPGGVKDWTSIWFTFAAYAAVLAAIFPFVFKYRHTPRELEAVPH